MASLDIRPGAINVVYRPGNTVTLVLTWTAGVLDGHTYTALLGEDELDVAVVDDVMTVVASDEVTEEHLTRATWVLVEDDEQTVLTGLWSPSFRGTDDVVYEANVTTQAAEIAVSAISGGGGGAVASVNGRTGAVTGLAEQADLTAEAVTRAAADTALDGRLDTIEAVGPLASAASVTAEAGTRATADAALDGRVDALELAPPAHAATHADGGSDEITVAESQVTGLAASLLGKQPLDPDLTALAAANNSGVLAATTASFTTADETKLDHLTVTQAVDLDTIEARVNSLDAAVVLRGNWDASAGTFPGGGTAQAGDSYIVTTGGTVNAVVFAVGDRVIAIADNASTSTFAANWFKADYTDQVLSVDGRVGAVTLSDLYDAAGAAAAAQAAAVQRANHTGTQSADTLTDGTTNKAFLAIERTKLAGVATGATANDTDANLKARANHTGTQTLATISDAGTAAAANTGTGASNVPTITQADARYLKRSPLVTSIASSATPTFDTDTSDVVNITALATAVTSMTSGKTGSPQAFQKLLVRFKDDGTARSIAWGADYEACGVPLPTTTVVNKRTTVGLIYSALTSKWGCVASVTEV